MNRLTKLAKSFKGNKFKDKTIKISPLSYVDKDSNLSSNIYIDRFCIMHNINMGSYSYIGYGCKFNNVNIGRYCSIASDIKVGLWKHPVDLLSSSPIFYSEKNALNVSVKKKLSFDDSSKTTKIGNDVWIGTNVVIMDGLVIGNGAIIAAGSIVTKDVEPFSVVAGIPAKKIKYRFDESLKTEIILSKWWEKDPEEVTRLEIYNKFRR